LTAARKGTESVEATVRLLGIGGGFVPGLGNYAFPHEAARLAEFSGDDRGDAT